MVVGGVWFEYGTGYIHPGSNIMLTNLVETS